MTLASWLGKSAGLFIRGRNPVAGRQEIIATGIKLLHELIKTNLAKARASRKKKWISDWTFTDVIEGVPIKSKDRLVYGNTKLKGILIWDLPAVTTCPSCEDCTSACYAARAQMLYPLTMAYRWANLLLYLLAPRWLEQRILQQVAHRSKGYTALRIHASGDFFDQDYVDWWEGIVRRIRNQTGFTGKIYTYSKAEGVVDLDGLRSVGVNILTSYLPDGGVNFTRKKGDVAEAKHMLAATRAAGVEAIICPATRYEGKNCGEKRWGGHCTWCLSHRHAIFVRH
jgi:hypothetical protein